jgi:hypothetical protein
MVRTHEQNRRAVAGLVIWMFLSAATAAQDGGSPPATATPPTRAMTNDPVRGLLAASSCNCGGPNELGLARSVEAWPCPCHGNGCDTCLDPLKSKCPNEDEYFLVPPRLKWYFAADGGGLRRDPTHNFDFASLNTPQNTVLSTRDFNYDFAAAGRFLIGYTINECFQIEGVYIGSVAAENSAAVRNTSGNALGGVGNLFSPFSGFGSPAIPGLDYNTLAEIRYKSSFQSGELNIRRKVPMPAERMAVSILFGVRYAGLPEEFDYHTQSLVPLPGGSSNSVHVSTDNQMVGPQIGALFEMYIENRWWINFEMKAALLNNRSQQTTTYVNVDSLGNSHTFLGNVSEDHTAFLGDLALTFAYRWSPKITTRIGYQAMFLENMALAPNNFQPNVAILTSGPPQLHHGAGTIYHGPFAGIVYGW